MDKKRRILLSTLIKTLEFHQMDIDEMGEFFVEFEDSKPNIQQHQGIDIKSYSNN